MFQHIPPCRLYTMLVVVLLALIAPVARPAEQAQAQVFGGSGFASAVACLSAAPRYATTSLTNTITGETQVAAPSDPALVQLTSSSAATLAPIGSMVTPGQNTPIHNGLGAVYGLAYDDGSVSGIRRLFAAAYLKRSVALGPGGLGAIYEYRFATGTWGIATTVPNVGSVSRSAANTTDSAMLGDVGRVGLGDLELAPDGRTLYAMNLYTRQIERYDLRSGALIRQSPLSIPFHLISTNPAVQADLRPFALGFWPVYTPTGGGSPVLMVGLVDSATRSATGDMMPWTFPRAYALYATYAGSGSWGISVNQDLSTPGLRAREDGTTYLIDNLPGYNQASTWNPWRLARADFPSNAGGEVRYPQPMLTDISFSRDGRTMYLGLRDRSGDMFFSRQAPAGEQVVISQGDLLTYVLNGSWQLQGNGVGDFFDDNSHLYPGPTPAHIENFMGAAAISLGGTGPSSFSEQLLATSLLGANTSGTRTYNAGGGGIAGQQMLHPLSTPGSGKATALGDVELLCTYALVGGRLWQDINNNDLQDAGEPALPGVQLEVFQGSSASDPALAGLSTDAQGRYLFAVPPNTPLNIRIAAASRSSLAAQGWRLVNPNQGGSDTTDSDASNVYGYIEIAGPSYSGVGGGVTGIAVPMPLNRGDQRDLDIGLTQVADVGQIGDRVWDDSDHDGVQDSGEPGHAGYGVTLSPEPNSMAILPGSYPQYATTDASGNYRFINLPAGRYQLRFATPAAPFQATLRDRGGDDARDSDVDAATGYTSPIITLTSSVPANADRTIDFGLFGGTPDVWVSKSGPAQALVGETFSYRLDYGNAGALPAAGVTLIDSLPPGVSYLSASPAPSSVSGQTISWALGTLAIGAGGSITLNVRAPASIGPATSQLITNQAGISTSTPNDPPGNNSGSSSATLVRPEVGIVKVGPAGTLVGDEFNYTLSYANTGSIAAASVQIADTLPAGIVFSRFMQNPGAACSYAAATRRVSCSLASLPAGASGGVVFAARSDLTAAASVVNTAAISTATGGDNPANNSSSATSAVQFPNPGVGVVITPDPFPVGESGSITATFRNSGTGVARSTSLTLTLPSGVALGSLPGGCSFNAGSRVLTCSLGDLSVGASGSRVIPALLPPDFAADQLAVTAVITTTTPERPADQADNSATASVGVVRPNVFVQAAGPASIVGQGSAFWYTVDYGNQHRANPSLTRTAENVVLRATLPADVVFVQADLPPTGLNGQTISWELGSLAANAGGQIHIVVQTSVPAGATLHFSADIGTTTPGDDPRDNYAEVDTAVVQPPATVGQGAGDLRLAIHSDLDPNSQDGDPANGVYLSEGDTIAWPAGEVLDFTPQLRFMRFPDEPLPFPYEYRARAVGWSLAGFRVSGTTHDPQAADSRGLAGCRAGAQPIIAPQKLSGCAYAYLGGQSRSAIEHPAALSEAQLAGQAHVYWTQPPAPQMRGDVFLYTLDPLGAVGIRIQVEVEVWIVNAYPGDINGLPLPEIPVVPLPDPERQLIAQEFIVNLLVPRSVLAPGSR